MTANAMMNDVGLYEVSFIPRALAGKLRDLEICTVLQLAQRLESEASALGGYLDLDEASLEKLCTATRTYVKEHLHAASLRSIYPQMHRRGVAVHRLSDRSRPRFKGD